MEPKVTKVFYCYYNLNSINEVTILFLNPLHHMISFFLSC